MSVPKDYLKKAQELQAVKGDLEAKGAELEKNAPQEQAENGDQEQAPADNRALYAEKTAELIQMNEQLQQQGEHLARKEDAGVDSNNNARATAEPRRTIGKAELEDFTKTFKDYQNKLQPLYERIKNNYNWWKLRNFGQMSTKEGTTAAIDSREKDKSPRGTTAWTVNAIINKHADYMDNYPEAICLPVEKNDIDYAKTLTYVLPCIYERACYEQTYSNLSWYKPIMGTSVTGYFWDNTLLNGLGDVSIKKCNILNLAWEPWKDDIQDSEYFFSTQYVKNKQLEAMHPDIDLKNLSGSGLSITQFEDNNIDVSDMSLVIDVYYHRKNSNGKSVLHYCQYVGETLLFASENDEKYAETGYYKHGKYPFVFDPMFPIEGSPCGFGYVDILKDPQKDVDELTDDFRRSAKDLSHRKAIFNKNSGIDAKKFADATEEVMYAEGTLSDDNYREVQKKALDPIYMNFYTQRIDEMREVGNNREVSSGGTTAGVTAASAIAAMQEAGSKTSRDQEASAYRAFKEGCYLVLELISEFYDETRYFRITGENGEPQFIGFNNEGIKEQIAEDGTSRKPIFDIKVKPQKRSAYSTLAHNELMVQLWGMGVFDPQTATQSASLIEFMEFEGKDKLLQKISQNGTIYQQLEQYKQILIQLAQMYDYATGGAQNITGNVEFAIQNGQIPIIGGGAVPVMPQMNRQNALQPTNGNNLIDSAREQARSRAEVRQ